MRAVVVGAGAVGARAARQIHDTPGVADLVVVDVDARRSAAVADSLGAPARVETWSHDLLDAADLLLLAHPVGHRTMAEAALERGTSVVSVTDSVEEVRSLLRLDVEASERGLVVAVGAGFAPGLSCLLARHAGADLTAVDEVHVAKSGTGGPACARHHHRALAGEAIDWRHGAWLRRPAGSGRELCWFPDPVGGLDCYRAALPDPMLLRGAFPRAERLTARVSATRRDRITARLPMLRRPHAEATIGAIRVEVRGRQGAATDTRTLGVLDRPAVAAGTVAAVAAVWIDERRMARPGAAGLGELVADPLPFLQALAARGIRAAVFEGAAP